MQIPILQKNICLYFTLSNVQTSSYEQRNTAQADYVGLNLCFWSHASPIILLTYYKFNFFKKCIVCTWLAPVFWRPRCSSCSSGWTCLLEVRKVCTVATIFSGTGTCKQMVNLCITHTHKNRASPGGVMDRSNTKMLCVCCGLLQMVRYPGNALSVYLSLSPRNLKCNLAFTSI